MTTDPPVYGIIGATGQQGTATIRALLADGARVRALVRDPASAAALHLRQLGADLAIADLDDHASLVTGLTGVDAAFAMTIYSGATGTQGEVKHGKAIGDAATDAGLPRLVYSSVGGAERNTGIPHFESKRRIEEHLSARVPVTFVRPTFFMDNLARTLARSEDPETTVAFPLAPDIPLQMIAVKDIGIIAAAVLQHPESVDGDSIEIAGDELTGEQIAAAIGQRMGKPARYVHLPLEALGADEDRRAMFRWFAETPAYRADFERTRSLNPGTVTLEQWLTDRG